MPQDVRPLIEKHYSIERVKEMELYDDGSLPQEGPKKRAFLRGKSSGNQEVFSVALITCTLGKQLLSEMELPRAAEE